VSERETVAPDTEVEAEFADLDVQDGPLVGIIMGSKSDWEVMEKAAKELEERGISHEMRSRARTATRTSWPATRRTHTGAASR